MSAPDLANLTALANICANGAEIAGLSYGALLLIFSFIPRASGLHGYSLPIAGFGLLVIVLALLTPAGINGLTGMGDAGTLAGLLFGGLMVLVVAIGAISAYFLPTIIACLEKKKNKVGIVVLNIFAFIPLCWLIGYIWACIPEKRETITIDGLK